MSSSMILAAEHRYFRLTSCRFRSHDFEVLRLDINIDDSNLIANHLDSPLSRVIGIGWARLDSKRRVSV